MPISVTRPDGSSFELSIDQEEALVIVLCEIGAESRSLLAGAAGTGKTTVMLAVIAAWQGKIPAGPSSPPPSASG